MDRRKNEFFEKKGKDTFRDEGTVKIHYLR